MPIDGPSVGLRRAARQKNCLAAVLFAFAVLPPVIAGENYDHSTGRSRADSSRSSPSPFRLVIEPSAYRVQGRAVSDSAKKHRAAGGFSPLIERHARATGLDPDLVHALIRAESAYRPEVVSPKGAIGLMQVMPETGKRFGVSDLAHVEGNVLAGTTYLRHLLDRFNDVPLALAAYNAGEGAVARYGNQIPPYPETRAYVQGILRDYGEPAVASSPLPHVYTEGLRLTTYAQSPYRLTLVPLK